MACQSVSTAEPVAVKQDIVPSQLSKKPVVAKPENKIISLEDFAQLYPVAVLKPESRNVYKKYGTELAGVCYACELATIKVTSETIGFINICDDKDSLNIPDSRCQIEDKQLRVATGRPVFIFTKVDAAPVYSIEIKGKLFSRMRSG